MSTLASPNPVVARGLYLARRLQSRRDPARPLAGNRYPVHVATQAMVVVDRGVLGAAIVPEGERVDLPAEGAGELPALLMCEQILQ